MFLTIKQYTLPKEDIWPLTGDQIPVYKNIRKNIAEGCVEDGMRLQDVKVKFSILFPIFLAPAHVYVYISLTKREKARCILL